MVDIYRCLYNLEKYTYNVIFTKFTKWKSIIKGQQFIKSTKFLSGIHPQSAVDYSWHHGKSIFKSNRCRYLIIQKLLIFEKKKLLSIIQFMCNTFQSFRFCRSCVMFHLVYVEWDISIFLLLEKWFCGFKHGLNL